MTAAPRILKGILFDLDGVVAETEDLHRRAYNLAFEEAGLTARWSEKDYRDRLHLTGGSKLSTVDLPPGVGSPDEFRERIYVRKRLYYLHLLNSVPLPARPGVVPLIQEALNEKVSLGAASTCAKEGAVAILDRSIGLDLRSQFSALCAGDDVVRRKPAPDVYLAALRNMGLEAAECIAIEDTRHGLESARSAGLCTLVTPSQYTLGDDFPAADKVVEDLASGGVDLQYLENLLLDSRNRS
jgi:HAD superfamily hydrolase (TIGR01509 family)